MGIRRVWLGMGLLLIPVAARASDHKFGAFAALSHLDAKGSKLGLTGWHVSGEATIKTGAQGQRWLSLAADISANFVGEEDSESEETDPTQITFAFGPRVERNLGRRSANGGHTHTAFLHTMVGAVYRSGVRSAAAGGGAGSLSFGGGYSLAPGTNHNWALRLQVDYIWPISTDLGHGWRYSAGLLFRFPPGEHGQTARRP